MRNRDLVYKLLERLEGININLRRIVNTKEPLNVYLDQLNKMEELIDQIKSMVETEPININ